MYINLTCMNNSIRLFLPTQVNTHTQFRPEIRGKLRLLLCIHRSIPQSRYQSYEGRSVQVIVLNAKFIIFNGIFNGIFSVEDPSVFLYDFTCAAWRFISEWCPTGCEPARVPLEMSVTNAISSQSSMSFRAPFQVSQECHFAHRCVDLV